jgi:hypothetical protein
MHFFVLENKLNCFPKPRDGVGCVANAPFCDGRQIELCSQSKGKIIKLISPIRRKNHQECRVSAAEILIGRACSRLNPTYS